MQQTNALFNYRLYRLWFCLVLCSAINVFAADITVRKHAEDRNPSIFIERFDAGPPLRQHFTATLRRANWFRVVDQRQGSVYQLSVVQPAPDQLELKLQRDGIVVAHFLQRSAAGKQQDLVFGAIDTLILKVFNNPGPCRGRLAFVLGHDGKKEIFVSNFDGSDMRQITFNSSISTEPNWGPNGNSLVYTLYGRTGTSIMEVDLVNQRQRRLTRFPGLNSSAALSPDAQLTAATLSLGRRVDLYLMQTNAISARAPKALTADDAVESSPTWSPDGRRICFVSDRLGVPQLFVISANGGAATRLPTGSGEAVSPSWSPVKNQICFASRRGRQYVIAVHDMNTSETRVVTSGGGNWEAPAWLPDGRHIVCTYSSGSNQQRELVIVDSWYGTVQRLTAPSNVSLPAVSTVRSGLTSP